ncbi:MAG: DUF4286 family protein [Muribaculaceae bacterium]|nr:DUF4286 family protein [Muribaculaceae bacterium]
MTILNTTFIVADHLMEQFLAWARQAYMPALRDAGIFTSPTMAKVLAKVEPGATSIAIQARCHALEEATRWHDETAALLKDDLTARFGQQVLFFTTYMEVLE